MTARNPRWAERAAAASSPDDRLAVAHDRLRAMISHLRRRQRDQAARARDCALADRLASSAADFLTSLAEHAGEAHGQ